MTFQLLPRMSAVLLAGVLATSGCTTVSRSTKSAVGAAARVTADATKATVDATKVGFAKTKVGFAKTKDFLIPWGKDDGEAAVQPTGAAAAGPAADLPAAEPDEQAVAAAAARADRAAVSRATLNPSDFGGADADRSGLWAVAGWQVEAEEAWLERDGLGEVAKFLARGDVTATRNSLPSPTVIEATSFSVLPGEGMLVARCRRVTQGGYEIRATAGSMTVAIRSDGAISITGASESRYVGAGG